MSVIITERCILCGACEWECPTQAIIPTAKGPIVDVTHCTECYGFFGESQCIVVCPVDAIKVRPESDVQLLERYKKEHPSREPQATWIWRRIGCADAEQSDQQSSALSPERTEQV